MKTSGSAYGFRMPENGTRITAHYLNYDGRDNDLEAGIFEPDVDDPTELLTGTLIIENDRTPWGDRTTAWIRLDNGALRQIEPDTVRKVEGDSGTDDNQSG